MKLVEIVAYRAGLITVTADQLEPYLRQLQQVPTMPIDQCAALEQVNARVALKAGA